MGVGTGAAVTETVDVGLVSNSASEGRTEEGEMGERTGLVFWERKREGVLN
jgi:hypothetical protein